MEMVIKERGRRVYAHRGYRLEVSRYNSRWWKWRVWHVMLMTPLAAGMAPRMRQALAQALTRFRENASIV